MQQNDMTGKVGGKPATCRSTSVKWRSDYVDAEQKIRFPAMTFN